MPKFEVELERMAFHTIRLEIDATDESEAEAMALCAITDPLGIPDHVTIVYDATYDDGPWRFIEAELLSLSLK